MLCCGSFCVNRWRGCLSAWLSSKRASPLMMRKMTVSRGIPAISGIAIDSGSLADHSERHRAPPAAGLGIAAIIRSR